METSAEKTELGHVRCYGRCFKGQLSTEFILLLSIILVLALVVVGMLADIPGTLRLMSSRGSNDFWANSDIAVKAHTFYSDGRVVMLVKNLKPYEITFAKLRVNDNIYDLESFGMKFKPGEQRTLTLKSDPCVPNSVYSLRLVFSFYDDEDRSRGLLEYGPDVPLTGRCERE